MLTIDWFIIIEKKKKEKNHKIIKNSIIEMYVNAKKVIPHNVCRVSLFYIVSLYLCYKLL